MEVILAQVIRRPAKMPAELRHRAEIDRDVAGGRWRTVMSWIMRRRRGFVVAISNLLSESLGFDTTILSDRRERCDYQPRPEAASFNLSRFIQVEIRSNRASL
ncbi:hypothetical protein GJ689_23890 [Rhodoplanes serenus]|uniref:Uncharacterized protein n=1 Tax=Rhodoplanes serenus TaxID=200615 RepID=A0A9X4XQ16_9BRAD|nr:hypothetical protein [Rhodoplanes serenus]